MEHQALSLMILGSAGVAGAAFAWPMRHFRGWRWEHVWIGQALTSNLLFPLLTVACLWRTFAPEFAALPAGRFLGLVGLGAAWGLGGVGYGLSVVRLGLSFTYSVVFSITTLTGALLPWLLGAEAGFTRLSLFLLGLAFCTAGTVLLARAGARRHQEQPDHLALEVGDLQTPFARPSYTVALCVVLSAGVFSASVGLALAWSSGLVAGLIARGISPATAPLLVWIPVYLGSAAVAISYGLYCGIRSGSLELIAQARPARNWCLLLLMGVLGFGNTFLYGFGASVVGHPSKSLAWALYMTFYILAGNLIGLSTREWQRCSRRTYLEFSFGIVALLGAIASLALA